MGPGERRGKIAGLLFAVFGVALLTSCSSGDRPAAEGVLVFNDDVILERGAQRDSATREFTAPGDGIFVVTVGENDTDLTLRLSRTAAAGVAASRVDVDSHMYGVGVEIGVIE